MVDAFAFLGESSFHRGALLGSFGFLAAAIVALAVPRMRPIPLVGAMFAGAAAGGVFWLERPPHWLAAGLLALSAGAAVAVALPATVRPLAALPGALILAGPALPVAQPWVRVTLAVAIAIGGSLVADLDRRWRSEAVGVPMLAASMLGIYATVPDTEEALILLGAMVPVALLGFPLGLARLGAIGATVASGLMMWNVGQGGRARETAIVGGVGCLGMFVVEPVIAFIRRPTSSSTWVAGAVLLLVSHLAVVGVASRVAGIRERLPTALAAVSLELMLAVGAALAISKFVRVRSVRQEQAL